MKITPKYYDFIATESKFDVLEGTTQAGKTTTAISTKFLYEVMNTKRKKHLIASDSVGTLVSNILDTGDVGLLDTYPDIELFLNGNYKQKLPHLTIGDNTVFLVGYSDIRKFKKVLGGQFGAAFIDEVNIADMSFIREFFLPRFEYCCATLNPDNPDKEIYKEIINRCRPVKGHEDDVPPHIWDQLKTAEPQEGWHYWYFTFDDNPIMNEELRNDLMTSLLPETREYQTKILGIRTKGVGLIFSLPKDNIITKREAMYTNPKEANDNKLLKRRYQKFTCGVDTAYSSKSADTFAFIFGGITADGKYIVLDEQVFNNKNQLTPKTPSDIAKDICDFVERNQSEWGICPSIFVDSADQATITECQKYNKTHGYNFRFINSYKKLRIIDRINLQNSWIASKHYLIVNSCKEHIREHGVYSWNPNKDLPEDGNDHTINGSQYAFTPFKMKIGRDANGNKEKNW